MSRVEMYQQEIRDAIEWCEYQRDMFEMTISKDPDEIDEVLDYWKSVVRKTETAITALRAQLDQTAAESITSGAIRQASEET